MKKSPSPSLGHPNAEQQHAANYAGVVHALLACEEACTACADACQDEIVPSGELRRGIRLSHDCSDVCGAMLRLLMRQTGAPNQLVKAQLQACLVACHLCAEACRDLAGERMHCRICAEICQHCADKCHQLIEDLAWNEGSATPFLPTWT